MLNELQSSVSKHNKNTENPGLQQMNNVSQKSDTLSIFLIFEDNFVLTWIRQSYRNVVLSYCQLCGLNSYEAHLCIFLAFPLVIYISRQVCIYYRKRSPWRKKFSVMHAYMNMLHAKRLSYLSCSYPLAIRHNY